MNLTLPKVVDVWHEVQSAIKGTDAWTGSHRYTRIEAYAELNRKIQEHADSPEWRFRIVRKETTEQVIETAEEQAQ